MNLTRRQLFGMVAAAFVVPAVVKANTAPTVAIDKDTGVAIRFIRTYDLANDCHVSRLDAIYGCSIPWESSPSFPLSEETKRVWAQAIADRIDRQIVDHIAVETWGNA